MSQQEEDPSRYTRTLVVKPALSQMYDQVEVPRNGMQKLLHSCVGARHVRVPRSRNFSDSNLETRPTNVVQNDGYREAGYRVQQIS